MQQCENRHAQAGSCVAATRSMIRRPEKTARAAWVPAGDLVHNTEGDPGLRKMDLSLAIETHT